MSGAAGIDFASHGMLDLSFGRRFWDRAYLEGSVRWGWGEDLMLLEPAICEGVLLGPWRQRWGLGLGWRLGYAGLHLRILERSLWTEALLTGPEVAVIFGWKPALELRATLRGTGYYNELWGFTVEPGLSVCYRFE